MRNLPLDSKYKRNPKVSVLKIQESQLEILIANLGEISYTT